MVAAMAAMVAAIAVLAGNARGEIVIVLSFPRLCSMLLMAVGYLGYYLSVTVN
jgi:hypothetical protein